MTPPASLFIGRKACARRALDPDVRALLREYLAAIHDATALRRRPEMIALARES